MHRHNAGTGASSEAWGFSSPYCDCIPQTLLYTLQFILPNEARLLTARKERYTMYRFREHPVVREAVIQPHIFHNRRNQYFFKKGKDYEIFQ